MASFFVWALVLFAGSLCLADTKIARDDEGPDVTIEDYPGLVQIEFGTSIVWVQSCAGNIMTSRHILTSARCFSGRFFHPRYRRVRAGASLRGEGGQVTAVMSVSNHPSFSTNGFDGDISVVTTAFGLTFGAGVAQVPIIAQGVVIPDGLAVEHAGWGSTAQGDLIANRELRSVDLVTFNIDQCSELYQSLLVPITVTNNMVCSGLRASGGRNRDLRDAGGPLYWDNILIGVISFGHVLGNDTYPVVSTLLSSYTNWVVDTAV